MAGYPPNPGSGYPYGGAGGYGAPPPPYGSSPAPSAPPYGEKPPKEAKEDEVEEVPRQRLWNLATGKKPVEDTDDSNGPRSVRGCWRPTRSPKKGREGG
uniref:Uncharacterized protein n=1 Tax=Oryza barthii TaxID=65489 RepID=A0A0D3HI10_9ORYZ